MIDSLLSRICDRPTARVAWAAALLVLALFLALSGWVSWHRGIWYDEIWSLYFSSHRLSFGQALSQWWLQDNHPPAFYALAWLTSPLLADDIFARRMLNIAPIVLTAGAVFWLARSDRRVRDFAIVEILFVLAAAQTFDSMIEYRSLMTQVCAGVALATAMFAIAIGGEDYRKTDRSVLILFAAILLVAFNFHYIGAFIVGVSVALFIASQWLKRKRRWAVRILLVAIVAGIPLVIAYVVERSVLHYAAETFWTTTTTTQAIRSFKRVLFTGFPLNWLMVAAALWAFTGVIRRRREDMPTTGAWLFALVMAMSLVVTIAILLAVNVARPFIIPRYLVAIVPLTAAILAALSADTILRHRWVLFVSVIATGVAMQAAFQLQAHLRQWDATARPVAEWFRRCPSMIVHARPRWIIPGDIPRQTVIANEADVVHFGYRHVAGIHGFKVEPAGSRRISADCPTLLWIEQHSAATPANLARWADLPVSAEQIARAEVIRGETGFVIVYPAAEAR